MNQAMQICNVLQESKRNMLLENLADVIGEAHKEGTEEVVKATMDLMAKLQGEGIKGELASASMRDQTNKYVLVRSRLASDADFEARNVMSIAARVEDAQKNPGLWNSVKREVRFLRDWIAKQIQRLNSYARKIIETLTYKTESERGFLLKLKEKIFRVIEVLTRKLHDFIQADRGNIEDTDKKLGKDKIFGFSRDDDYIDNLNHYAESSYLQEGFGRKLWHYAARTGEHIGDVVGDKWDRAGEWVDEKIASTAPGRKYIELRDNKSGKHPLASTLIAAGKTVGGMMLANKLLKDKNGGGNVFGAGDMAVNGYVTAHGANTINQYKSQKGKAGAERLERALEKDQKLWKHSRSERIKNYWNDMKKIKGVEDKNHEYKFWYGNEKPSERNKFRKVHSDGLLWSNTH